MDIASDAGRSLVYVSICGKRPAIYRFDLSANRRETVATGRRFCGHPLAVHAERFLVLINSRLNKRGYPSDTPRRRQVRIVDLEQPDSGQTIQRPGAPLDAVVVPRA